MARLFEGTFAFRIHKSLGFIFPVKMEGAGTLFSQETAQEALMFAIQTATKRKAFIKAYVQVTARNGSVAATTLDPDEVLVGAKGGKHHVYKPQTLQKLDMSNRTFRINSLYGTPSLAFMVNDGGGEKAAKDSTTELL